MTKNDLKISGFLISLVVAIAVSVQFLRPYISNEQPEIVDTRTEELIDPESPELNCSSGIDGEYTYVRCNADRYGRMLFIWIDAQGKQYVIGDVLYTQAAGILLTTGTEEIIVTFTDMDSKTAWRAVQVVPTSKKECTFVNNCTRV